MRFGDIKFYARGALILAFLISPIQSASAHTAAVNYVPAVGAQLIQMPSKVEISFNEELLVLKDKQTSSISVTDNSGTRLDYGDVVVEGRGMSVDVKSVDTSGEIKVVWRAVAQDGHPVEGNYSFSVTPSVDPSPSSSAASEPSTTAEQVDDSSSYSEILVFGSVILVGLTLMILRWRRNSGD